MVDIVIVDASDTHALRRSVLRRGDPAADVHFGGDDHPAAFHLAAVDGHTLVAVASFSPSATPWRPERFAVQLRGMAVQPDRQGQGLGRSLLDRAMTMLRTQGCEVLWANARDSALGFYTGLGMEVVGDGFVPPATGLPHHVVVLDLAEQVAD
jgi:GNAT superfamily N-acetyltransferase